MPDKSRLILVADDEPRYVWAIRHNLEARGYRVVTAGNGPSAIEIAAKESPDLVLLDVRMPGLNGHEVCLRIREFSTVPVIMLTALAAEADKVKGLDGGADDYLTKPFSAEELLARVRAALRRADYGRGDDTSSSIHSGDLRIDLAQQRVFLGEREIALTGIEYRLLAELCRNPGRLLVPEYLLERVWGPGFEGDTHLVRQAVHRLRRKIEPDPDHPRYIETRRGLGYLFLRPE